MSSTAPATPGGPPAAAAVRPAQGTGGRKPGTEDDNGLFASLLMLVSDTRSSIDPDAASGLSTPHDAAPALPDAAEQRQPLPTRPGGAPEPRPDGLERGHGQPTDGDPARGPLTPADRADTRPPGMVATRGPAAEADAAAPAPAEQAPPPGAPGRPAPAAPFLGRRAHAAGAGATGPASLQGFQWRKAQAPTGTAAGSVAAMPASGAAAPFSSMAATASSRAAARSTVALHERFGASPVAGTTPGPEAPASGSTLGFVSALTPGAGPDARTTPAPQAPGDAGSEAGPTDAADATASDNPPSAADAAAQAAEDEARQISHWGTQTLRHASLRVGQDGGDAIDIRLSLAGQAVQVDFRTDSAEARASLQQHANESLAELLQRSGIQLGGVSVGAQGQGTGQGASPDARAAERGRSTGTGRVAGGASGTDSLVTPATPRWRADGSQPLDVFV